MYAKKTVASDQKLSDNTYISSRISSLDKESDLLKPLVKTFLKQRFLSAWLHGVSSLGEKV
jgi:hypothetical protein